ncbi:hypothetical protein ['Camptotheca acuminata' phytoplasma]|uniref:hypothetical protein n=1 Tax='Camptotheca acuminata' phytoplasma TaxID=3239192 RepID=UPI00351A83E9
MPQNNKKDDIEKNKLSVNILVVEKDKKQKDNKDQNNKDEDKIYFNSKNEEVKILKYDKNVISSPKDNTNVVSSSNKEDVLSFSEPSSSKKENKKLLNQNYVKDFSKKHSIISWKHNLGSLFSKKIKLFYDIEGAKVISCESFKEWLNLKQFIFYLFQYHIPKIDFVFDFLNISGLKEEFIDNRYDKIGLELVSFFSLLKKDPSLGYFYFKDLNRNDVNFVNVSLCNCKVSSHSIVNLILEIINFQKEDLIIFKNHLMEYLNHLREMSEKHEISSDHLNISIEEFLDRIIDTTDIEMLDKNLVLHLVKTIILKFIPKAFSLHFSLDHKNIKPTKEMNFDISLKEEHKTIGFVLKIKKNKDNKVFLYFYEIFQDEFKNEENLRLIDSIAIFDTNKQEHLFFNHLIINITQNKNIFFKKTNLFGVKKI